MLLGLLKLEKGRKNHTYNLAASVLKELVLRFAFTVRKMGADTTHSPSGESVNPDDEANGLMPNRVCAAVRETKQKKKESPQNAHTEAGPRLQKATM